MRPNMGGWGLPWSCCYHWVTVLRCDLRHPPLQTAADFLAEQLRKSASLACKISDRLRLVAKALERKASEPETEM